MGSSGPALGLALRGLIAGGLLWVGGWLALGRGAWMAALVVVALAALAFADAVRLAGRRERMLRTFAEALASGAIERPADPARADRAIGAAIDKAAERIERDRRTLRAELDRLAALADTVGVALYMLDSAHRIRFANRAAHQLVRSAAERFGAIPAIGDDLAAQLEALAPGTRVMVTLADGRSALAVATAFGTPDGEALRLISLQALVGDLDAVELKAWQDLSRVLAHEMMNSLAPIVSMTESLQALIALPDPDRVQLARAVETIGRRSAGLMRFIDRYRAMAELPPPELAPLGLRQLIEDLARLVRPGLAARGIRLDMEIDDRVIVADAELLSQAVLNLLKNAGEAAAGHVLVAAAATPAGIEIRVEDDGPGVPDNTDALFLPFYTTRDGHDGIGLSIARQVALAHRGTIRIDRLAPGSRFTILLPD